MPDARIASALTKIIQNSNFKKKALQEEQKAPKEDRFLRGRPIAYMIYEYFRVTGTLETILDFSHLVTVTSRGDDVGGFDTKWDEQLLSTQDVPSVNILECLYKTRLRESDQLKTVLALYDREKMPPGYQRSETMVKKFLDQKSDDSQF